MVEVLNRAEIEFMVTGSFASSLHGRARSTHDIDIVVDLGWSGLRAILDAFPAPRYYISEPAAREAVATEGTFNLLDSTEGEKVDFWMLSEEPFDLSRFARKLNSMAWGFQVLVSTPEDTILQKLRWAHLSGGSAKQTDDARQILKTQGQAIDHAYMVLWAERLGVREEWRSLLNEG